MINPDVYHFAELQTDGRITDRVLRDVAAMHRLPLYIGAGPVAVPRSLFADGVAVQSAARMIVSMRWSWGRSDAWGTGPARQRYRNVLARNYRQARRALAIAKEGMSS